MNTPRALTLLCAFVWIICAIRPLNVEAWILEQLATVTALLTLVWALRGGVVFCRTSQYCIAAMIIFHTIGTHFTYSLTPYDEFARSVFGFSINELFGWQRNHYDRFVHFLYGLFLALPAAQVLMQRLRMSAKSASFLGAHVILSTSALYELVEWLAARLFGSDLGNRYLGNQGDIWDAQADIALAGAGCTVAYICWLLIRRRR